MIKLSFDPCALVLCAVSFLGSQSFPFQGGSLVIFIFEGHLLNIVFTKRFRTEHVKVWEDHCG